MFWVGYHLSQVSYGIVLYHISYFVKCTQSFERAIGTVSRNEAKQLIKTNVILTVL